MQSDDAQGVVAHVATRLRRAGRRLLLMLDFDGTLVDIAPTPDGIAVPADARHTLSAIAASGHRVWIVSGRTRAFLLGTLELSENDGVAVVGLHGIDWPGDVPMERDHRLDEATRAVAQALDAAGLDIPLVEDKGLSLAFHTRSLVGHDTHDAVVGAVVGVLEGLAQDGLSMLRGHEVIELRPSLASKGRAARRLMTEHPGYVPVFIGDDVTDEDAFAVVADAGGGGVCVRVSADASVDTAADFVVDDPAAVWRVLTSLLTTET